MTDGIIYMCFGKMACDQASLSIKSLHRFTKYPVCIVGDEDAEEYFNKSEVVFKRVDENPFSDKERVGFRFMAGRIKPLLAELTPFDRTLYVDADTAFRTSPSVGFNLLDKADVALAETETRSILDTYSSRTESDYTCKLFGNSMMLYHNSGMIFWKRNDKTDRLFELWSEEWNRFQNWDEQVALLRALILSDVLFINLPFTWNCRHGKDSFLLHHWFGTGTARAKLGTVGRQAITTRSGQKMIKLEIAPGRYVKCFEGDEEMVLAKFRKGR